MSLLITKPATLSYPWLAKAQPAQDAGQKDKHGLALVFGKGDDISELEAAARAVAIEALGEKKGKAYPLFGGKGSPFRTDLGEKYPNIEGAIVVSARNEKQPGLVYRHPDPATITETHPKGKPAKVAQADIEEVFYPGAKVKADIKPFYYDKGVNKGISWALNGVQKWAEGERLDNRVKAEDAFEAEMAEAPAGLEDLA